MVMCSESCVQRGQDILYHLHMMFYNTWECQKPVLSGWHMINGMHSPVEELKDIKNTSLAKMANCGSILALVHE